MSDDQYPEFTSAQTERLDEIDNAVYFLHCTTITAICLAALKSGNIHRA